MRLVTYLWPLLFAVMSVEAILWDVTTLNRAVDKMILRAKKGMENGTELDLGVLTGNFTYRKSFSTKMHGWIECKDGDVSGLEEIWREKDLAIRGVKLTDAGRTISFDARFLFPAFRVSFKQCSVVISFLHETEQMVVPLTRRTMIGRMVIRERDEKGACSAQFDELYLEEVGERLHFQGGTIFSVIDDRIQLIVRDYLNGPFAEAVTEYFKHIFNKNLEIKEFCSE